MSQPKAKFNFVKVLISSAVLALILSSACALFVFELAPLNIHRNQNRTFIYSVFRDIFESQTSADEALKLINSFAYTRLSNLNFWFYSKDSGVTGPSENAPDKTVLDFADALAPDVKASLFGQVVGPFGSYYVVFRSEKFHGFLLIHEPKTGSGYRIRQKTSELTFGLVILFMFIAFFTLFIMIQRQAFQFHELLDLLTSGGGASPLKSTLLDKFISRRRNFQVIADRTRSLVTSLRSAEVERSNLIAQIAHDLRTPLTSLRTSAETLSVSENLDPKSVKALTAIIIDDVHFLNRLTDNLLGIADLERNTIPAETVDLNKLVKMLFAKYKNLHPYQEKQIDWSLQCDFENEVYILANETQIQRLVINLIDNAFDFAKSKITLGLIDDGDYVKVFVTDDGPGLSKEAMAQYGRRTEGRFATVYHHDKRRTSMGLGSVIILETAQAFGATVHLSQRDHVGLCVEVRFRKHA